MMMDTLSPFSPESFRLIGSCRFARRKGRTLLATKWGVRDLSRINLAQLVVLLEGLPRATISVDDLCWILRDNPTLSLGAPTGRQVAGRLPDDTSPSDTPFGPEVYVTERNIVHRLVVRPDQVEVRPVAKFEAILAA
jgi:hypothetical protein